MSVSGRRLARVAEEYIRARQPVRIKPSELQRAMEERGYLIGSHYAKEKKLFRILKRLSPEMSENP